MFSFNKSITKKLLKASKNLPNMTKLRYDWLTDNADSLCGCIYKTWFSKKMVFIVIKDKLEYKLVCCNDSLVAIYLIENIEQFLGYIGIDELLDANGYALTNADFQVDNINKLPISGMAFIQDNKLFLYDYMGGRH